MVADGAEPTTALTAVKMWGSKVAAEGKQVLNYRYRLLPDDSQAHAIGETMRFDARTWNALVANDAASRMARMDIDSECSALAESGMADQDRTVPSPIIARIATFRQSRT